MQMNLDHIEIPQLYLVEERSKMLVIRTINQAKERVGIRLGLEELADTAAYAWKDNRLNLTSIEKPIHITAAKFIANTIEDYWKLTTVFKYNLDYKGQTTDEVSHHYYFEAIFSQPTAAFPIPQATASVYFRIEDEKIDTEKTPKMLFRVEGNFTDHDVRYVAPTADWLLALIQKKIKFFKRIETLKLF
ncbi:unnamed protein product [Arctia plantaginis]|uniref:Uncharacterized protein n=1 Tax=Arctia plantaginis TaxID=874455 RepID=A0A8S1BJM8_ARCPL|nr:unnamed protein product [Arctia plantaginis]